jgi:hypothetical protein
MHCRLEVTGLLLLIKPFSSTIAALVGEKDGAVRGYHYKEIYRTRIATDNAQFSIQRRKDGASGF